MSISSIRDSIDSDDMTVTEVVEGALNRAKQSAEYNVFINLTESRALSRAKALDEALSNGQSKGRLFGVPFVAKDNFLAFGAPTTAGSKMLEKFDAPYQATAIEKLEAEGAICIGKTNLDAFAHGGSTENSFFGVTRNASDMSKVAGGSSGGSAVATALGIVPFALGTDTGGSIRQPASFNGVYGYKPTYGMISRHGVISMASSTDTVGCFAQNIEDIDIVSSCLAGKDRLDMTTHDDYYQSSDLAGGLSTKRRIGLISETITDEVDLDIRNSIEAYVEKLRSSGHIVEKVSLKNLKYALAIYYIVVSAEISSNLARFDGIRYGYRSEGASTLDEVYGQSRDEGLSAENKRRILTGSYVLSEGYFDAYYLKAQKARTLLIDEFKQLFENFDFLLSPTTPSTAFGIGEKLNDPVQMYLSDVMTVPASLAGLPAISLPIGKNSFGLPIGAQIMGAQKTDSKLLHFLSELEGVDA